MISLKEGVRLVTVAPQLVLAHMTVANVWQDQGLGDLVVTSACDGNHTNSPRPSGHYAGHAFDYRTQDKVVKEGKDRQGNLLMLRDQIREALGPDFLVLMENVGSPNEHLHVEWLPRRVL